MGELDEKETAPTDTTPTQAPEVISIDEPKETEKLLTTDKPVEVSPSSEKSSPATVAVENETSATNGTPKKITTPTSTVVEIPDSTDEPKPNEVTPEGREVKPKKIPIGGIKMPGFFTKSKPKMEGDGADGELLEQTDDAKTENADEKPTEPADGKTEKSVEDKPKPKSIFSALKIRNPFAKREPVKTADAEDPDAENENDSNATEKTAVVTDGDNPPPKKGLLNAIRLPIVNIIPKKLRPVNTNAATDVESGNGPNNKAGLASMETLDDSLKDTDNGKDVTDKSVAIPNDDLETEKLTDTQKEKQKEADSSAETAPKVKGPSIMERITEYECSPDDYYILFGTIIFIGLVAVILCFTFNHHPELDSAPLRDGKYIEAVTSCGSVEGIREDSAFAFRGIPYARSPVGDLRFMPAQPLNNINDCWNGTLQAHNATPVCWQTFANGSVDGVEDCLKLDIITPHVRYDNPLPVVVLIGAESFLGDSPNILRPSARYSRARDIIFVRPNFRLGALGFMSLDMLSKRSHPPTSGNYALSDLVTVLQWIQVNIIHFGGDANAVTIFGHRTGATLVSALATSKMSQSLFSRAWMASGSSVFPGKPLNEYERQNAAFTDQINCQDAKCLLDKEGQELFDAVPDTWHRTYSDLPAIDENTTARHEWLVLDGVILKQHPSELIPTSTDAPPLVVGTTKHEAHSEKLFLKHKEWTPELVKQHIQDSKIGQLGLTEEALKLYNATYAGLVAMISDIRTVCPLLTMARAQRTLFYVVTQVGNGDNPLATVDDDVQAILGRYEPKTPEQRRYVSAIQQLFYHYASFGQIPQFDLRRQVYDIGQDALTSADYPNCDFWIKNDVVPRFARID